MQGIFAEAYQRLQGRTGSGILKGQKAIDEMNDAMKKGQLNSDKMLPLVAQIAKQMAAGGIDEARMASWAEENRFYNQLRAGRDAFRKGGGEEGLKFFWQMMQNFSSWFEANGALLGGYFESAVRWLDTFRLGVYEFIQFAVTGNENSLVEWVREWGINLVALRDSVMTIIGQVEAIFRGGQDSSWLNILTTKLQNFSIALQEMFVQLSEMLDGVQRFANGYQKWADAPLWRKLTLTAFEGQGMMIEGAAKATWNAGQATLVGGGALMDLATKSTPNGTDYQMRGNGKGGYSNQTWIPTAPSELATRPSDVNPEIPRVSKLDVRLDVQGNQELIAALMDERAKVAFPVLLSSEIAKQVVNAPKSGSR